MSSYRPKVTLRHLFTGLSHLRVAMGLSNEIDKAHRAAMWNPGAVRTLVSKKFALYSEKLDESKPPTADNIYFKMSGGSDRKQLSSVHKEDRAFITRLCNARALRKPLKLLHSDFKSF